MPTPTVVDPLLAEGAGLAARADHHCVLGMARAATDEVSPVTAEEYQELGRLGFPHPYEYFKQMDRLPVAYFGMIENQVAARTQCVNCRPYVRLVLEPDRRYQIEIHPEDGSPPLLLDV